MDFYQIALLVLAIPFAIMLRKIYRAIFPVIIYLKNPLIQWLTEMILCYLFGAVIAQVVLNLLGSLLLKLAEILVAIAVFGLLAFVICCVIWGILFIEFLLMEQLNPFKKMEIEVLNDPPVRQEEQGILNFSFWKAAHYVYKNRRYTKFMIGIVMTPLVFVLFFCIADSIKSKTTPTPSDTAVFAPADVISEESYHPDDSDEADLNADVDYIDKYDLTPDHDQIISDVDAGIFEWYPDDPYEITNVEIQYTGFTEDYADPDYGGEWVYDCFSAAVTVTGENSQMISTLHSVTVSYAWDEDLNEWFYLETTRYYSLDDTEEFKNTPSDPQNDPQIYEIAYTGLTSEDVHQMCVDWAMAQGYTYAAESMRYCYQTDHFYTSYDEMDFWLQCSYRIFEGDASEPSFAIDLCFTLFGSEWEVAEVYSLTGEYDYSRY